MTHHPEQSPLHAQYQEYQNQLQTLTIGLEEEEEIAGRCLVEIISHQGVANCVKRMAQLYVQLVSKHRQRQQLLGSKQAKQAQLSQLRQQIEHKKQRIRNLRTKLQQHIVQSCPSIGKLLEYASKHNMHTMMHETITSSIHSIIHSTHPCQHRGGGGGGGCVSGCQYGEMVEFVRCYKNGNICARVQNLWVGLQREVYAEISQSVRTHGHGMEGQLAGEEGLGLQEREFQASKWIMDIKVDLQILNNQLASLHTILGLEVGQYECEQFIDAIIGQLQSNDGHALQYDEDNLMSRLWLAVDGYVGKIAREYRQQNITTTGQQYQSQCQWQLRQLTVQQVRSSLQKAITHFTHIHTLETHIKQIQKQILSIQAQLQQKSEPQPYSYSYSEREKQGKQTGASTQGSRLSIGSRYNIQAMVFRVAKTMHISNAHHPATGYGHGSNGGISGRSSNRNSLRSTRRAHRTSIPTHRQPHSQCLERVLQFGKNKLILRKENPHFHQEIQIKRIVGIKVVSEQVVHLQFRKGYMSLQFLPAQPRKYENPVREWVKIFQVVYDNYTGTIEHAPQHRRPPEVAANKENSLCESNCIVQKQKYEIPLMVCKIRGMEKQQFD